MGATKHYLILLIAFFLSCAVTGQGQEKQTSPRSVAGTYSNFTYNQEGGDLNGVEIRFIPTRKGTKAVVQFAEGGAGDVVLVDAVVSGSRVSFLLPPGSDPEGDFVGIVSAKGLDGTFKYKGGASEHLVLPRGASYWDKPASRTP